MMRITIPTAILVQPSGSWIALRAELHFCEEMIPGATAIMAQQFLIAQGGSYTGVARQLWRNMLRKFLQARITALPRTYTPATPRPLTKAVNTGWVPWPSQKCLVLRSDILSLWGMSELGKEQTDKYTLSLTISHQNKPQICKDMGIATLDAKGNWVNAVSKNIGKSTKKFVKGPWNSAYGLGTYGINSATGTAWAVLDYNADFAVACLDSLLQP